MARLTELSNEERLLCAGGPFAVYHLVVGADVETKFFVAPRKLVGTTFVLVECLSPYFVGIVALHDGGDVGSEVAIVLEDDLWVERGGRHSYVYCWWLERKEREWM